MSKFEVYKDKSENKAQCWRWRLLDNNGENIARSEEGFLKTSIALSIKKIIAKAPGAERVKEGDADVDKWSFEYFESKKDDWYWRLRAAGNSEIMAIGGEGFVSKSNVLRSIENVQKECVEAKIDYENPSDDPACDAKEKEKGTDTRGIAGS